MRLQAKFDAQSWVNDYAVSVDPQGPTTWDCTDFVQARQQLLAKVSEAIEREGSFVDLDDELMADASAPAWVRDWSGPFTITVEPLSQD